MIAGFVAVTLLAASITMLPSHALLGYRAATGMPSSQQAQASTVANKLPIEEVENMSLVFSTPPAR